MAYQRRPGKFESSGALGELFHAIMLESFADDSASGGGGGADRFNGPFEITKLREAWPAEIGQLNAQEIAKLKQAVGAIVVEDSQGFVDVGLYEDSEHFEDAWNRQQKRFSHYDDDDDGVDDFANNPSHSAYRAAQAADEAWSNELRRLFGKKAGDVRYTSRGAGAPGSKLRRLHDTKLAADEQLRRAQGHSPNASTNRQQLEALVWKHKHKDYRGITNGIKYVLVNTGYPPFQGPGHSGGTESWPLSSMTTEQLCDLLPRSVREAHPELCGMQSNARRGGPADEQAATELEMYIDNDSRFSMDAPGTSLATGGGQGRSILLNQLRKFKKGKYDHALAPKAWGYVVEAAAKEYAKEFDRPGNWMNLFTPATRDLVAQSLAESFLHRAQLGEFDHVDTRIGR